MVYLVIGATFSGWDTPRHAGSGRIPRERLVQDLTLAEHLDEYLEVGSFEFLSQLADSQEFTATSIEARCPRKSAPALDGLGASPSSGELPI